MPCILLWVGDTCSLVSSKVYYSDNIVLLIFQVGLPGGKKESQESNAVGLIVGAAAGGILFALVILLTFCCCCCRRRGKLATSGATSSNSTSSSQGATGLEHAGSCSLGFNDSSQKLLPSSLAVPSSPRQNYNKAYMEMKTSKSTQIYNEDYQGLKKRFRPSVKLTLLMPHFISVGLPLVAPLLQTQASSSNCDMEISELLPTHPSTPSSPRQQGFQPKTLMVTSSGLSGENFHTFTEPDQYPDLLNIHPQASGTPLLASREVRGQLPLNPAALVMPPTPPAQFPHQFQHLIHHSSKKLPSVSTRAHSPVNHPNSILVSPLLSPPAQFSSSPKREPKGYVTLPRKLTSSHQSRGPIDWSVMSERPPIYDGVGPRTSATGTTNVNKLELTTSKSVNVNQQLKLSEQQQQQQPKRSLSLKRFPDSSKGRESSGSEVTLGN